jgi:small-conductance mechanosensitive channel
MVISPRSRWLVGTVLGLVFASWATVGRPQLTPPPEPAPPTPEFPDPLRLDDGWWEVLQPEGKLLPQRVAQWQVELERTLAERSPDVQNEIRLMLPSLALLASSPSDPAPPSEPASADTLSRWLQVVEGHHQVQAEIDSLETQIRLDRSLAKDVDITLNQTRQAYLQTASGDSDRALLGWRRMRLWSKEQVVQGRLSDAQSGLDHLKAERDQLDALLNRPTDHLSYDESERAFWMRQLRVLKPPDLQSLVPDPLSGEPDLDQVIPAARARITSVRRAVAEQADWLIRYQLDGHRSPPPDASETIRQIESWCRDVQLLQERLRNRVGSTIENVGITEHAASREIQQHLLGMRSLNAEIQNLEVALDQDRRLGHLINLTRGWSLGRLKEWASDSARWVSGLGQRTLNRTLFNIGDSPVTGVSLLRMSIIIALAVLISRGVRRSMERLEKRRNISSAAAFALNRLLHSAIIILGWLIALSSIGIELTKFALFASALGVGLGFGLQAIVSNFVSGLIIVFERSLKIGDFVELESGIRGRVREINVRGTVITTNDNIDILVPNSEFVNGKVINWTLRDVVHRLKIPFGVAYGSDKELVKKAALEAADAVPVTLQDDDKKAQVWLTAFGDSSLNFQLVVWVSGDAVSLPEAVSAAYTWAIESALKKYGIEIPFPQRDLHLRSFFGLTGNPAIDAVGGKEREEAAALPEPMTLTRRERRELQVNDAIQETMRAIEAEKLEKAAAAEANVAALPEEKQDG